MEKVAFKLDNYQFPKATIDFTKAEGKNEIELQFAPEGQFEKDKRLFRLHFSVRICLNNSKEPAMEVHCVAEYSFQNEIELHCHTLPLCAGIHQQSFPPGQLSSHDSSHHEPL